MFLKKQTVEGMEGEPRLSANYSGVTVEREDAIRKSGVDCNRIIRRGKGGVAVATSQTTKQNGICGRGN